MVVLGVCLGPYGGPSGDGCFFMSEVPLYAINKRVLPHQTLVPHISLASRYTPGRFRFTPPPGCASTTTPGLPPPPPPPSSPPPSLSLPAAPSASSPLPPSASSSCSKRYPLSDQ